MVRYQSVRHGISSRTRKTDDDNRTRYCLCSASSNTIMMNMVITFCAHLS